MREWRKRDAIGALEEESGVANMEEEKADVKSTLGDKFLMDSKSSFVISSSSVQQHMNNRSKESGESNINSNLAKRESGKVCYLSS